MKKVLTQLQQGNTDKKFIYLVGFCILLIMTITLMIVFRPAPTSDSLELEKVKALNKEMTAKHDSLMIQLTVSKLKLDSLKQVSKQALHGIDSLGTVNDNLMNDVLDRLGKDPDLSNDADREEIYNQMLNESSN